MGVHRVLGDAGFAGERLHRAGAAQVGRDREHREDAEQGETGTLERVIVGDDAGDEEAEHEHQSTGGEYADENVQMRPGLRDQMHVVPLTKYDNADGRACDLCPPQARFASRAAGPMWLRDDEGSRVPPPIARRGIRRDQRGRDQRGRDDQRGISPMPPPSQLLRFLLDGPLQVRCPGVPDVYHHCVIGAKGAPAHFAISSRRNFRASWRGRCAYLGRVIFAP